MPSHRFAAVLDGVEALRREVMGSGMGLPTQAKVRELLDELREVVEREERLRAERELQLVPAGGVDG